jgi:hypothetical protein
VVKGAIATDVVPHKMRSLLAALAIVTVLSAAAAYHALYGPID